MEDKLTCVALLIGLAGLIWIAIKEAYASTR